MASTRVNHHSYSMRLQFVSGKEMQMIDENGMANMIHRAMVLLCVADTWSKKMR